MSGLCADVRRFRLLLRDVLTTGRTQLRHRDGLLLSVTDGTHTGWGEATPMPGWSPMSIDSVAVSLAAVSAAVSVIDDPADPRLDHVLDDLDRAPHARAALAGAIADLRARRVGSALSATLGPSPAARVRVNAMTSAENPDDVAAFCAAAVDSGFESVKIKVGLLDTASDLRRVAAARSAVGPDLELRIDANGSWDVETAIAVLGPMAELGVCFCEEPADGIASIAAVGSRSDIPVAVDESARCVDDIAEALGTGSIDVVIVKPQAIGGPDMAMRAVRLTTEFGATAVVTSMIDGAIGVAHALHVAAASGVNMAHGLATSSLLSADIGPAPEVSAGGITIGDEAGIGIVPYDTLPT